MPRIRVLVLVVTAALLLACSAAPDKSSSARPSPPLVQSLSTPSSALHSSHQVTRSGPCVVTHKWQTSARARLMAGLGAQNLLGDGPVYPGVYTPQRRWRRQTVVEMENPRHFARNFGMSKPRGWLVQKVLWKISRDYRGPVSIRGHQVGGEGQMKFSANGVVSNVLRFRARGAWPSYLLVPHAGCYAWNVRGRRFRTVLVFRAVCVSGQGYRPCA
jgi:hypothetical protein